MILSYSIASNEVLDPAQAVNFRQGVVDALPMLGKEITKHAWSPCVWESGKRAKANFIHADLCALDFDNGYWDISDAKQMLKEQDLAGLIGITKSHQKEKGGEPACDRFRVVMLWEGRISDLRTYEQNMGRLMAHMPVDRACKDGARFFFPCTEIVHIRWGGNLSWLPYQEPKARKPDRSLSHDSSLRQIPSWMEGAIRNVMPGERNKSVFRFAIRLKERKFSQQETVDFLAAHIDLDRREIERTVTSAWRY